MNTRKYPRTLEQAFGAYARGPIHSPPEPMHTADKVVLIASGCAFGGLIVLALIGWFA